MAGLLIFDLDGTLVETAPDLAAALNVAMAAEGLAPIPLDQVRSLVGAGVRALIERGLKVNGASVSPARLDALQKVFLDHYGAHIADLSRPYPGLIAGLERLRGEGWRFAVATNKLEAYARQLIDELDMNHWFVAITGGDTFPFKKPDGRHLAETVRLAGGGPAIMVGDSATDVNAARDAGLPVIGVSFGYTDVPMKDLNPDVLIDHFDAFHAAVTRLA